MIDRASKALAEASLAGEPQNIRCYIKMQWSSFDYFYYRDHRRRSKKEKDQLQQYLTPSEEEALEKYLKLIADLGNPVRIRFLCSLAFSIARRRSTTTNEAMKPPGKNWPQGF